MEGYRFPPCGVTVGGLRVCAWCGLGINRTGIGLFCSDNCEHEHKMRTSGAYLRRLLFERDGGVCALCHLDTIGLERELEDLRRRDSEEGTFEHKYRCQELGISVRRRTLWDMDHIVPVCEGGGECTVDDLRTLCLWCHQTVNGDLHRKRAGTLWV
jgi:5-methylcytosine-specific restriction endonuclease McrA